MLSWTLYSSLIGVGILLLLPQRAVGLARTVALLVSLFGACVGLVGATASDGSFRTVTRIPWIPSLGIEFHLGADGISVVLVLLTGVAAVAGVLFSWNVTYRVKEFFAYYLTLVAAVYGVFLSFDLFQLFVFYELAIIPKYFLIAIWGSTNREYGAMKLALYSMVGSAFVLIGIIAVYVAAGSHTMDLFALSQYPFAVSFQQWVFPLIFIGFGVLAGLWPFHTWAPTGHVAAPTAVSMLLAGVVMKLGAYGSLRVGLCLFPQGALSWQPLFGSLAVVGIIYGGLVALVQRDFKFVIGYSSVSHMGFVMLGLMTLNALGVTGAVVQMLSHGVIAGLLFAVVGRMIYDRTHTRELSDLEGMRLARQLPFAAAVFVLASMASMGLPGFSGFVAELLVLLGAWQAFPVLAVLAGVGIVVAVVYTLRVMQKSFFGSEPAAETSEPLPPITLPERLGALLLLAMSLVIGLYPQWVLDLIQPSFRSVLFEGLWNGGAR